MYGLGNGVRMSRTEKLELIPQAIRVARNGLGLNMPENVHEIVEYKNDGHNRARFKCEFFTAYSIHETIVVSIGINGYIYVNASYNSRLTRVRINEVFHTEKIDCGIWSPMKRRRKYYKDYYGKKRSHSYTEHDHSFRIGPYDNETKFDFSGVIVVRNPSMTPFAAAVAARVHGAPPRPHDLTTPTK